MAEDLDRDPGSHLEALSKNSKDITVDLLPIKDKDFDQHRIKCLNNWLLGLH